MLEASLDPRLVGRATPRKRLHVIAIAAGMAITSAIPAHAIIFERLVDCCPMSPTIYYGVNYPSLSPDGCVLAYTDVTTYPWHYEWWPHIVLSSQCGGPGGSVHPPEHVNGWVQMPEWSPDGRFLAFVAGGYGPTIGIYIYDTIFGMYQRIEDTQWVMSLAWTQDGQSIVYQVLDALYRVDVQGGAPVTLGVAGEEPTCGPDNAVAFVRGSDLWILADNGQERQLTNTLAIESSPAWSPDGKWIAFASDRSGNVDIWITAATGGTAVQITTDPAQEYQPSWSGNSRLVFARFNAINDEDIWLATDLPDWTIPVESRSWGTVKSLYR